MTGTETNEAWYGPSFVTFYNKDGVLYTSFFNWPLSRGFLAIRKRYVSHRREVKIRVNVWSVRWSKVT